MSSSRTSSLLANLPSTTNAFTRIGDQRLNTSQLSTPVTYVPTHDTAPPAHQVIVTSDRSPLLQYLYQTKLAKELPASRIPTTQSDSSPKVTPSKRERDANGVSSTSGADMKRNRSNN